MSDIDIDDRNALLEAFPTQGKAALPTAGQAFGAPVDRPVGAQQVAIYRDDAAILRKIKAMAAAAGQDWYYRFPVRNRRENRTDYIEGPSIKLANDLARMYGNCEVDTRVQDNGAEWLIYARFVDIETGFAMTRPFQQRKKQSSIGGGDEARALDIALQIGVSKAIRNVIVNALQTFADFAFDEARSALVDKIGKALPQYRDRLITKLQAKGIDLKRVDAVVGRASAEWLAPDVARVIAMVKSIEDGMASLDETFPVSGGEPAETTTAAGTKSTATKQSLAGKLDTLAADPKPGSAAEEQQASQVADHDPATGEVDPEPSEQAGAGEEDDVAPADPHESLINDLRSAVMDGAKVMVLLNALPPEQRALVTEQDKKDLTAAQKAVEAQSKGGAK